MRGAHRTLLSVAWLCTAALPALAADPFAEYRIPEHRWLSWSAGLNANGSRTLNDLYASKTLDRFGTGTASTSFTGGYDSDPRSHAYGLSLQAGGSRQTSDRDEQFYTQVDNAHRQVENAQESASAFFALSRFPWQAPLGFSLSTSANIRPSQRWSSQEEISTLYPPSPFATKYEDQTQSNSTVGSYNAGASLGAAISWGHVRDATPVYQVQVLEQRLHETGTIQGELTPGARERLAALYTVQSDLAFAHQRPTKYFWRELERLLADDGVLGPGGLDAYTVQRLLEPVALQTKSFARVRGYSVGPQVFLAKSWTHSSFESAFHRTQFVADTLYDSSSTIVPRTKIDSRLESILTGMFVEYHRPFGMQWQADAFSRALVTDGAKDLLLTSSLSATWAIADRWQWVASLRHDASAPGKGMDRKVDQWTLNAATSLNYFFEDSWAFLIGYQHGQSHSSDSYGRSDSYSLGVSYQFAGWLDAPGLFAPMRLGPP